MSNWGDIIGDVEYFTDTSSILPRWATKKDKNGINHIIHDISNAIVLCLSMV